MSTTRQRHERPRSLVTQVIRLSGADPVDVRMFLNSSGRAAIKRLGIRPVAKGRTKTTITGRHIILAPEPGVRKHVRRRKGVPVHRWTLSQAALIVSEANPRKVEYKQIKENALGGVQAIVEATRPLRRLPRHRRWSNRR